MLILVRVVWLLVRVVVRSMVIIKRANCAKKNFFFVRKIEKISNAS